MKRDGRDTHLVLACLLVSVLAGVLTQVGIAEASRAAGGTYSLPTGNPVVTGTAISSTVHNNTMSDLATEMTDSLNRSGKGAMLAGLQGYVGTVSLPGYTFAGDTNTGLYWIGADNPGMAAGGTKIQEWATTSSTISKSLTVTATTGNYAIIGNGSADQIAINGAASGNGSGVWGVGSGTGFGVWASGSNTGYGLYVDGDSTSPVRATLHVMPQDTQPTGANLVGDMYVTTAGVLKICTVAGTPGTWISVGAQP